MSKNNKETIYFFQSCGWGGRDNLKENTPINKGASSKPNQLQYKT